MAKRNNAAEENAKLMNGNNIVAEEPETFAHFLYNKTAGTVLGRTAKSWFQITVFYIIFYALLATFWLGCLTLFLKTLDPKVPRFYGEGTIVGVNPGVGYQPWLEENPDSTLVKFNIRNQTTYAKYVATLNNYMAKYNNTEGVRECTGTESNADMVTDKDAEPCAFDTSIFTKNQCGPKNDYGFKTGSPCIILSLNRLIGWRPVDYPANSIPEEVKSRYKPGDIAFNCKGAGHVDTEHIGKLKYIPESGINGRYYPYIFTKEYQQPIAMVKFESLPRNKLVIVECRAYALNIQHEITDKLGLVYFELFVEDKPPTAPVN